MDLRVNSDIFARISDPKVSLIKRLAAYDLVFSLSFHLPSEGDTDWIVDVHGAAVILHVNNQRPSRLGKAAPEQLLRLRPLAKSFQAPHTLLLPLQPAQMTALEYLRGGGELLFELNLFGRARSRRGGVSEDVDQVYGNAKCPCPQSHWIEQLRSADVRDILLFEILMPTADEGTKWGDISRTLRKAQSRLEGGDFEACISGCRDVLDRLRDTGAFSTARSQFAGNERNQMDLQDRFTGVEATMRHLTHLAHHGADEVARAIPYTYADAKAVFVITATLAQRDYELEMKSKIDVQEAD